MPDFPSAKAPAAWFWNWIRNVLRWSLIRRPGVLACLVEGCSRAADDVLKDIYWLRDQFNPETCELEYLTRHGAARGLTRHPRESDARWRRRVCAAMAWHKLAGRAAGMPRILEHYGYKGAVMVNVAAGGQPERWAHFRCDLTPNAPVTDADWELIRWILAETKPAKSVLETVTLVLSPRSALRPSFNQCTGEVVTVLPWSPALVQKASAIRGAVGMQEVEIVTIGRKLEA
ncbi:phage tail protein [Humidesulfovibrio sp.]